MVVTDQRKIMSPEIFKRVLGVLPANPTSVLAFAFSCYNSEDLPAKLREALPGFEYDSVGSSYLKDPSSELVLVTHARDCGLKEGGNLEELVRLNVILSNAFWNLGSSKVTITPSLVHVTYSGQEPDYVPEMRKILQGTGFLQVVKI